ncbi:hypothetical protein [Haloferula sp. BvORR071]|uniref:hypothetical protein n=1 Tax=Haloferula sp. BvORR071 TaxID=1396141 RepID=UPI0005596469|nr:hypothetical protein [Haloferula sp. BvORR071]
MNRPDREDATARALDILPSGDPAASDPRLVRDAALAEEARATREAVADVWLAVSPLRAAPPEVLNSVMDKIGLPPAAEKPTKKSGRLAPLLAASGWAAAAAVTICLWPHRGGEGTQSQVAEGGAKSVSAKVGERGILGNDLPVDASHPAYDASVERLRREYSNLLKTVEMLRRNELASLPRVMSLTTPDAPRRSPEESRQQMFQKMFQLVTSSLRDQLEVHSSSPDDSVAAFVIEHGYIQPGMDLADNSIVLRHRNFPEDSWKELGLYYSEATGNYFDRERQLLWTPDPQGGGFVGRKTPEAMDLSDYKAPVAAPSVAKNDTSKNQPEGFVLEDPVTKKAEVVIDQVPPLRDGYEQRILWTDASGASGMIPVLVASNAVSSGGVGNSAVSFTNGSRYPFLPGPFVFVDGNAGGNGLVVAGGASTVMASFSTTSSVTSFRLVQVPVAVAGQVTAGVQEQVIVAGGH